MRLSARERQRTASASSDDEGPSYRRLWETANGTAEKTTLAEMASRIEQLQAELRRQLELERRDGAELGVRLVARLAEELDLRLRHDEHRHIG